MHDQESHSQDAAKSERFEANHVAIQQLCNAYWRQMPLDNRHASRIERITPIVLGKAAVKIITSSKHVAEYKPLLCRFEDLNTLDEIVNFDPAEEDPVYGVFLCLNLLLPKVIKTTDNLKTANPTDIGNALGQLHFFMKSIEYNQKHWKKHKHEATPIFALDYFFLPWLTKLVFLLGLDTTKYGSLTELQEFLFRAIETESTRNEALINHLSKAFISNPPILRYLNHYTEILPRSPFFATFSFLVPARRFSQVLEFYSQAISHTASNPPKGLPPQVADYYKSLPISYLPDVPIYKKVMKLVDDTIYTLAKHGPTPKSQLSLIKKGIYLNIRFNPEIDTQSVSGGIPLPTEEEIHEAALLIKSMSSKTLIPLYRRIIPRSLLTLLRYINRVMLAVTSNGLFKEDVLKAAVNDSKKFPAIAEPS